MNGFDRKVLNEVIGNITTVRYSWEMVLNLLSEPDFDFKRSEEGLYKYAKDARETKREWESLDSFCKYTFFHCPYKTKELTGSKGKTRIVKYVDDEDICPTMTFCRNNYPYYLEADMLHYCLWTTKYLSAEECKAVVEMYFPREKHDIIIFDTPQKLKSIPDTHHFQVIVRPRKLGMLYIKIEGFEEKSTLTT